MYESAALKLHYSICVPEIVCVAGEIVRQREQSFGRGSAKPCGERQGDALNFLARFSACFSPQSKENGGTLTRTKTIPPASRFFPKLSALFMATDKYTARLAG